MGEHYDFCGYATKNDLLCSDGRTIRKDAFKECDGVTVPLVWNHRHDDPEMVLGHALLQNRDDGVYMYGKFNDTERGQTCKKILENKDLKGLSIHANKLIQKHGDVLHGVIREVSLVLAGANPGAVIDFDLSHSEEDGEGEVYAYLMGDEYTEFEHGDIEVKEKEISETMSDTNAVENLFSTIGAMTEEQKNEMFSMLSHADKEDAKKEEPKKEDKEDNRTIEDIVNTMNEDQQKAMFALIAAASEGLDDDEEDDEDEEKDMKHNAFDDSYVEAYDNTLTHADMEEIFRIAKKDGSLKEAFNNYVEDNELSHADADYGITRSSGDQEYFVRDPEMLFPDYHLTSTTPEFLRRDTTWVTRFMSTVKHSPFARIKTLVADITIDEARALGYVKGNQKKEEFFELIKRTTDPQTIYKLQKFDRDDVIDITDFDVVAWIKGEMRDMLEEEIARACLVGDGRNANADGKIYPSHVRPILTDDDLFTIKVVNTWDGDSESALAKDFVNAVIRNRKDYKGTGTPDLWISDTMLAYLNTMEDGIGRYIYETEAHLKSNLRVNNIVPTSILDSVTTTIDNETVIVDGILFNPVDYTIGTDKRGAVSMFDDFDIKFNQMYYLIETRMSGALVKPKSAMVIGHVEE